MSPLPTSSSSVRPRYPSHHYQLPSNDKDKKDTASPRRENHRHYRSVAAGWWSTLSNRIVPTIHSRHGHLILSLLVLLLGVCTLYYIPHRRGWFGTHQDYSLQQLLDTKWLELETSITSSNLDTTTTTNHSRPVRRPRIRIFGPLPTTPEGIDYQQRLEYSWQSLSTDISFHWYTRQDQRRFLRDFASHCQTGMGLEEEEETATTHNNAMMKRFDSLPDVYATELWKYCVLYTGLHNVYYNVQEVHALVELSDILDQSPDMTNRAIQLFKTTTTRTSRDMSALSSDTDGIDYPPLLHHGFLQIVKPKSKVCWDMMRVFMFNHLPTQRRSESKSNTFTTMVMTSPYRLAELLGTFVQNEGSTKARGDTDWTLLPATCEWLGDQYPVEDHRHVSVKSTAGKSGHNSTSIPQHHRQTCPVPHGGGACCQVWLTDSPMNWATMLIWNPFLIPTLSAQQNTELSNLESRNPQRHHPYHDTLDESKLVVPVEDLPYIATIREVPTDTSPMTLSETPNFFDILVENQCLPEGKECARCLKVIRSTDDQSQSEREDGIRPRTENDDNCQRCLSVCPCFCRALCNIRPPPKRIAAHWMVRLPQLRKAPNRLIPRIIHQTWYEPITKEKYPNMSRLIESFRQSGWEYKFYDDETAAQFLETHFPPQVREAYDAIIPGAFKADLFRYCVLLIRGGLYADMDVFLESNLDAVIDESVGFVTAQDEPGTEANHRSCLWNGFMASAPGHPFLMRTIENVVNNIRNRFTNLDYDDMLCPNPVLPVSHSFEQLFTCGPCILGASINDVLNRHRQHSFDYGEIDLFETERNAGKKNTDMDEKPYTPTLNVGSEVDDVTLLVHPEDPRLLVPGRTILLRQDKEDMGAHRFTYDAANIVVASTDLPDYDDRPKSLVHYSKTKEKDGVFGLNKLYIDNERANEEIRIRLDK